MGKPLTHFDSLGNARMVDVGNKPETDREARARGYISMKRGTIKLIAEGTSAKGDVLGVARVAAIQAAKRTSDLIPLCHPLALTRVTVDFQVDTDASRVCMEVIVANKGRTGVEMEALTAVSVGLLTIYDMCKAADKTMTIGDICLAEKSGGRSGHFRNPGIA
jgi:cyclic pyranopterin phosphate synthase